MNLRAGVPMGPTLVDSSDRGVLKLDLAEKLPASEFIGLIAAINEVYFANLWLGLAESASTLRSVPDSYAPRENEKVYLKRVEIGTPNLIELMGQAPHMLSTFATVATALGAPKIAAEVIHKISESRQAVAAARKIDVETELLKLDLQTKTAELLSKGKITREQAEHKFAMKEEAVSVLREVGPKYAHNPQFWLESPRQVMVGGPVRVPRYEPRQSAAYLDVEARLRALAGRGKENIVQSFMQAYRAATTRGDPASISGLNAARAALIASLGISEGHLDSILGGDVGMTMG